MAFPADQDTFARPAPGADRATAPTETDSFDALMDAVEAIEANLLTGPIMLNGGAATEVRMGEISGFAGVRFGGDVNFYRDSASKARMNNSLIVDGGVALGNGSPGSGPNIHADATNVYVEAASPGNIYLRPGGPATNNGMLQVNAGPTGALLFFHSEAGANDTYLQRAGAESLVTGGTFTADAGTANEVLIGQTVSGPTVRLAGAGGPQISGQLGDLLLDPAANAGVRLSGKLGFHGHSAVAQYTVTGSRGGNNALQVLLTALSMDAGGLGLIIDNTTP